VQLLELAEELDERALSECVVRARVERDGRVLRREVLDVSSRDPCGDKVAFIEDENDLLVRLFLPKEFQHGRAQRAKRVPGVEDVEKNVRGVDYFVELAVYASGGAFSVDRLDPIGVGRLEGVFGGDAGAGGTGAVPLGTGGVFGGGISKFAEFFEGADVQTRTLALGFGPKGVAERLGLDDMRPL
jgi:hypothetical protein